MVSNFRDLVEKKPDLEPCFLILPIMIFLINIIGQYFYKSFDFTDDKRFTLSKPTVDLIESQKDVIFVKVLLDGEFPSAFKRLQNSTIELLNRFQSINPKIDYVLEDPLSGSPEVVNANIEKLRKEGIVPVNLFVGQGNSSSTKKIYPYAILNYGKRVYVVNLLEPNAQGIPEEEILNTSVSLLEYKFANAIQKLNAERKGNIVFLADKGGIDDFHLTSLYKKLNQFYFTAKINIDSTYSIPEEVDLLIIAKPSEPFTKKNQFVIDQYIMHGGNIIWLIDKMNADLDSINNHKMYTPQLYDLGLDDLFFHYGVRVNDNLVQDLQCTRIPQVIGYEGGRPQIEKFPWYYDLLINSYSDHPVSKGLSDINMEFVSTIDSVNSSSDIRKTVLLTSSGRSRFQMYPMRLTYQILQYAPEVDLFNKKNLPIAMLIEGKFKSYFKNRLSQETEKMLTDIGSTFIDSCMQDAKMIFVGDGDFVKNIYDTETGKFSPIGYNKWEEYRFAGNEDFILNSVEYMMDNAGILDARSKRVKLRLLDNAKLFDYKLTLRLINVVLPLLLLVAFGFIYNYIRKKKYTIKENR